MKVQPIANQPNFNGKLIFESGTTAKLTKNVPDLLRRKFNEVSAMVSEKPYDIFISRNEQNHEFYYIAANKSLQEAKKITAYSVKVQESIMADSVVDAAKDAMSMYEKYISKGIKG